jgi:hypothetical protein
MYRIYRLVVGEEYTTFTKFMKYTMFMMFMTKNCASWVGCRTASSEEFDRLGLRISRPYRAKARASAW